MQNDLPRELKIISILYYIIGILMILGGILGIILLLISIKGITGGFSNFMENFSLLFLFNPVVFIISIFVIYFLIMGILFFFIGRGLKKKQRWSRTVTIILAFISVFGGINVLIQIFMKESSLSLIRYVTVFIPIIFNVIMGGYLLFNKKIISTFSNKETLKDGKRSKKYLYTFLIVLAFIVYGFFSYTNFEKQQIPSELLYPETELPPEVKDCEEVFHNPDAMPFSDRDLCYYNLAIEFENPNICSKIVSETFDDDCYITLEQIMEDYRICGLIDWEGKRGLCYLKYLEEMPVDINFCESLTYPGHEESCRSKFK